MHSSIRINACPPLACRQYFKSSLFDAAALAIDSEVDHFILACCLLWRLDSSDNCFDVSHPVKALARCISACRVARHMSAFKNFAGRRVKGDTRLDIVPTSTRGQAQSSRILEAASPRPGALSRPRALDWHGWLPAGA